ncbi:MAG: DUF748 domain-containing protein [Planctomycetota bacterium]
MVEKKQRRFGCLARICLAAIAGIVLVVVVGPLVAAPFVRRAIEKAIEERTGGTASIEALSFSLRGRAAVRGVDVKDSAGRPLAAIAAATADLSPLALARGRLEVGATASGLDLHSFVDEEGRWSLAELGGPAEEEEAEAGRTALPDLGAQVTVRDLRLHLHGPAGTTTVTAAIDAAIPDLAAPAQFEVAATIAGPQGESGALQVTGAVTAAADGRDAGLVPTGEIEVRATAVELAAFTPLARVFAPVAELAGRLECRLEGHLERNLALRADGAFTVEGLRVQGTAPDARFAVAALNLEASSAFEDGGRLRQRARLTADDFLAAGWDGTWQANDDGSAELAGTWSLDASLAGLTGALAAVLPLRAGTSLAGQTRASGALQATLAGSEPRRLAASIDASFADLAARDAAGHPVALGELATLSLRAGAEVDLAAGTLAVSDLDLSAGPVRATGKLAVVGLAADSPAPLEIRDSAFALEADLDRLRTLLAGFVDLEGATLGGRLSGDFTAQGSGDRSRLAGRLRTAGLVLGAGEAGPAWTAGDIQVGLDAWWIPAEDRLELTAAELASAPLAVKVAGRASGLTRAAAPELDLAIDVQGALERLRAAVPLPADSPLRDARGNLTARLTARGTTADLAVTGEVALPDALAAGGDGTWRRSDDGTAELAGTWTLDATLAGLTASLPAALPLRAGYTIAGDVRTRGEMRATIAGTEPRRLGASIDASLAHLAVRDAAGGEVALGELAAKELTLRASAEADLAAGTIAVPDLDLAAGPVRATGRLAVAGLAASAEAPFEIRDSAFTLNADLDRLRDLLAGFVDLEGVALGGQLNGDFTAQGSGDRSRLVGHLKTAKLVLGAGTPETAWKGGDVQVDLDAWWIPAEDRLKLTVLGLRADPLRVKVQGNVHELTAAAAPRLDLAIDVESALERLRRVLPLPADSALRDAKGSLAAHFTLGGTTAELAVAGDVTVDDLALAIRTAEGEKPWTLAQPKVTAAVRAAGAIGAGDVHLERLALAADALRVEAAGELRNVLPAAEGARGTGIVLEGVHGEAFYVPDRLQALLAPWLPGQLSGDKEERVTFALDGRLAEVDPLALLAGTRGTADVGLGRFAAAGFDTAGTVHVDLEGGRTAWRGSLAANGGTLALEGALDHSPAAAPDAPPPRSTLKVAMAGVGANSRLSPLLSLMHPAFGAVDALKGGEIGGRIDCDLELAYTGPLTAEVLAGGWPAWPKEHIDGRGTFAIRGATLRGSPLLGAMLGELGLDAGRTMDVHPIELTIEKGRVKYARPWTWTIGETKTAFTGSIGLDETVELAWKVPIDDALVAKYGFLSALRGEQIEVPITGTVRAPKLEWKDLITDLASRAAKNELQSRLGLGGGGDAAGAGHATDDPAELLRQADSLWKAGKKAEAAPIYKRLRDEYKLSLVYALNRDRIKERAGYREGG